MTNAIASRLPPRRTYLSCKVKVVASNCNIQHAAAGMHDAFSVVSVKNMRGRISRELPSPSRIL